MIDMSLYTPIYMDSTSNEEAIFILIEDETNNQHEFYPRTISPFP